MEYLIVKWLHIVSSTFLFGTGVGTAFYLLVASRTRDPRVVYHVAKYVVIADWLFTATTAVLQPVTGFYLVYLANLPLESRWIVWSTALFLLAGGCWLPVVWIQMRLRDIARTAMVQNTPLPAAYWRYFRIWVALGIPAFLALVVVFYLMVVKPQ